MAMFSANQSITLHDTSVMLEYNSQEREYSVLILRNKTFNHIILQAFIFFFMVSVPPEVDSAFLVNSTPQKPVSSIVRLSSAITNCPVLPGCPEGPSVPLPPTFEDKLDSKLPVPSTDKRKVAEGTGKYDEMLLIRAGPFEMGSPEGEGRVDERPRHRVYLKDFYIAKHEVTVKEYCDYLNRDGETSRDGMPRVKLDSDYCPLIKTGKVFRPKPGFEDKPIVCISWYGAVDYAQWAGGRLPTSAEWEKSALLTTLDPPNDNLQMSSEDGSVPVSSAIRGIRGITGMIGNVWEWCSDWYSSDQYTESAAENPDGPPIGNEKTIRGGSWASPDASRRIQNRHKTSPRGYYHTVGFRIVKD